MGFTPFSKNFIFSSSLGPFSAERAGVALLSANAPSAIIRPSQKILRRQTAIDFHFPWFELLSTLYMLNLPRRCNEKPRLSLENRYTAESIQLFSCELGFLALETAFRTIHWQRTRVILLSFFPIPSKIYADGDGVE